MLGNLEGWHVLVIVLVVVVLIVVAVVVIVLARGSGAKRAAEAVDPAARLAELKRLWNDGVISDAEYEAQRQQIIGRL